MRTVLQLSALLLAAPAVAGEQDFALKEGDDRELVQANCQICHSLDYIEMNSPFLDEKKWEATVTKMIKVYGAPIEPDKVSAIVRYLSTHYGP